MSVQQEKFKEIADAIREKTNSEELIKPSDFASKIGEVHEAGKQSGLAMFWNGISANGTRHTFAYSLGYYVITNDLLNYPITIQPTNANYMFQNVVGGADFVEAEKNGGVKFDFSLCTNLAHCLRSVDIFKFGVIDARSADNLDQLCYGVLKTSPCVKWIEKLIVKETHTFTNAFRYCDDMIHIIFEGVIGTALDISAPTGLDKESIESIFNCLSTTTSGISVTISEEAVNKAFETSEGANNGSASTEWKALIATKENWTISLL